ncbi:MAG TPA: EVE domain-containing protein [Opitutaceae bacterium]|nr:EVE domain-containing protein [Opitutaceae bacterium]
MTTQYWLVKQEPEAYAWSQFVKDRQTSWDGVRNYQARNNLRAMKKGDTVLFYVSVEPRQVVGIAQVSKTAYPDPTAEAGEDWVSVQLKVVKALANPVTLTQIKAEPSLANISLIRQSRLSVMPLQSHEYETILRLAER